MAIERSSMTMHEPGASTWRKSSFSNGASACIEVAWQKSSFSNGADACVEVGWRKSSFSGNGADCVEVAHTSVRVAVRDSKRATGPTITFSRSPWRAFLGGL
jgi:hypothetical protein